MPGLPGTRAASPARPCGRGGCRRWSGRSPASPAAAGPRRAAPPACPRAARRPRCASGPTCGAMLDCRLLSAGHTHQAAPEEAARPLRPAGLGILAVVSMVFGMMAAVSQDLPAIYNFAQYKASKNSEVFDATGAPLGTLTSDQNKILLNSGQISPKRQERGGRDRGRPLLRTQRRRLPGHRPRPGQGHPQPERPAGRLDDHRAVRQERARSAGQPDRPREVPRGGARLPARAALEQGQDPHRVPEHDLLRRGRLRDRGGGAHLLRRRPPRLRHHDRALRLGAGALGGGDAGRGHRLALCLRPQGLPRKRLGRRNLVLEKMYEQGYITQEQFDEGIQQALPSPADIEPPTLDSKAPYFTACLRQQLVERYGAAKAFFGGLKVKSTLDLQLQEAAEEAVNSYLGYLPATASVVVIDNQQRRHQGDGRRPRLRHQAVQPGDPGPPPARLLDQALHAADGARRGDLPGNGLPIRTADLPLRQARQGNASKSTTTRTPTSAPARSICATTYSDNSIYAQLALEGLKGKTVARPHQLDRRRRSTRWATRPDLDQPGDGARRPGR